MTPRPTRPSILPVSRPVRRAVLPAAGLLAAALVLSACGGTDSSASDGDHGGMGGMTAAPMTTATVTPPSTTGDSTATPATGEHNQADVMFAMMMIPHHAQAVQMSDLVLGKDGVDPRVTALARQIKAAQDPEIQQMRGWLAGWGAPVPDADGSMAGMDHGSMGHGGMSGMGMLSEAELAELEAADGPTGTRLFLTGMIEHHEGAIDMAERALRDGVNPDVRQLAQSIITSQRAEIDSMRSLLASPAATP